MTNCIDKAGQYGIEYRVINKGKRIKEPFIYYGLLLVDLLDIFHPPDPL
jgi:hypothetical protein